MLSTFRLKALAAGFAVVAFGLVSQAHADNFSFTGNLTSDDDVQLFHFSVGSSSTVTLRTWSYAGGTNAAGNIIARGGFDPILALFDASGTQIDHNDDGGCGTVTADALTSQCYDTYLQDTLAAGNYTVSVMEYDNFPNGNLSAGFERSGQGNFTANFDCPDNQPAFNDVSGVHGCGRDSHWAFDILGVNAATQEGGGDGGQGNGVPEPASALLLGLGITGLLRRRRV